MSTAATDINYLGLDFACGELNLQPGHSSLSDALLGFVPDPLLHDLFDAMAPDQHQQPPLSPASRSFTNFYFSSPSPSIENSSFFSSSSSSSSPPPSQSAPSSPAPLPTDFKDPAIAVATTLLKTMKSETQDGNNSSGAMSPFLLRFSSTSTSTTIDAPAAPAPRRQRKSNNKKKNNKHKRDADSTTTGSLDDHPLQKPTKNKKKKKIPLAPESARLPDFCESIDISKTQRNNPCFNLHASTGIVATDRVSIETNPQFNPLAVCSGALINPKCKSAEQNPPPFRGHTSFNDGINKGCCSVCRSLVRENPEGPCHFIVSRPESRKRFVVWHPKPLTQPDESRTTPDHHAVDTDAPLLTTTTMNATQIRKHLTDVVKFFDPDPKLGNLNEHNVGAFFARVFFSRLTREWVQVTAFGRIRDLNDPNNPLYDISILVALQSPESADRLLTSIQTLTRNGTPAPHFIRYDMDPLFAPFFLCSRNCDLCSLPRFMLSIHLQPRYKEGYSSLCCNRFFVQHQRRRRN